jgi:hypothetical protein
MPFYTKTRSQARDTNIGSGYKIYIGNVEKERDVSAGVEMALFGSGAVLFGAGYGGFIALQHTTARKRCFCPLLQCNKDDFTKTGPGQTYIGNTQKEHAVYSFR